MAIKNLKNLLIYYQIDLKKQFIKNFYVIEILNFNNK
jgi:hypothetical protein